jgi:hypothetical protein
MAVGGCEKNSARTTWDDVGRPTAAVAANRAAAASLRAPDVLAHVPADTPFVFAALEPLPRGYFERVCRELCPVLAASLGRSAAPPPGLGVPHQTVLGELIAALTGPDDLGIGATPRWVLYGLGTAAVFRIEVRDPVALAAALDRLGGGGAVTRSRGSQRYWHHEQVDRAIFAAIVGRELVVAYGGTEAIDSALPLLLADSPPVASMADGAALVQLAATHGFAGYGVGYIDVAALIALPAAEPAEEPAEEPSLCRRVLERGAAAFPRIVFGFDELVDKRLSLTVMLEAEPSLAGRLQRGAISWAPLTTRVANRPLAVLGLGAERAVMEPLLADLRVWAAGASAACDESWALAGLDRLVSFSPTGELADRGADLGTVEAFGAVALVQSSRVRGGLPQATDGYVVIGTARPAPLLRALQQALPGLEGPELVADGSYRKLQLGPRIAATLASPVEVGGRSDRVVISASRAMRTRAEASSDATAAPSPLLIVAVELAKVQKMVESWLSIAVAFGGATDGVRTLLEVSRVTQRLFSLGAVSVHATSVGLAIVTRLDLR